MDKLISVIIPNFNDPRIERTLQSIVSQSFTSHEIIIVEGCINNEKTKEIYHRYEKHIDYIIHEKDNGIFDALNKGILAANGSLIFLIGSDDVLSDQDCFSTISSEYSIHPDVDGFCIGCRFVNSKNMIVRKWKMSSISSKNIKLGLMPPHFSLFLKRQLYDQIGLFNFEKSYIASDSDWLLRLATMKEVNISYINNHYVDMEYGGASTGSINYITRSISIIASSARKYKIPYWYLTPVVKLISKLFQIKLKHEKK